MRARLADESGFSLVELLAALVVGTIVLFATFGLLDAAVRLQAKSVDGIDATDRGRIGIDQVSQGLASRICIGTQPSLVDARDDSVEFYASLAPESGTVRLIGQRRRLTVVGDGIREEVWEATPPTAPPVVPPANTTTPKSRRLVVTGIKPIASTAVFRYYANEGTPAHPTLRLATPLSAADLARVAMIDVSFVAQGKRADVSTTYSNQIFNRNATCID
jgi:prepilin-type N-terminal cleavage/methylation domain-containing protein